VSAAADPELVRPILSRAAGVLRAQDGLASAIAALLPVARSSGPAADPAIVALLIAVAALRRRESRGSHFRTDFPEPDASQRERRTLTLEAAFHAAREIAGQFRSAKTA
jgi:L-aspartate oxidase